jgi:hypothetical protein
MAGITRAHVNAQAARIRELEALLARAGAEPTATPQANRKRAKKHAKSASHFASLAGAKPSRTGKGAKFTLTLGDLTFACEDKGNGKIIAHAHNGAGDERWIVFRPSDPQAMQSGAYLAVVARRYGLVK